MATVVNTSTLDTATAYSNQRKVDRTQNGVLWAAFKYNNTSTASAIRFYYSTDNGQTWSSSGTHFGFSGASGTYEANFSFFIDIDDFAHVAYKDGHDGRISYRRGTPNAARTAWTWSAVQIIDTALNLDYPDIVAHREGTGWKAHLVYSYHFDNGTGNHDLLTRYNVVTITSSGAISDADPVMISPDYSQNADTWPSIDFNHTGDGKTVAGGTPHLYAAWSSGVTGTARGIRFKKATYSAGSWTWGTERDIDTARYINTRSRWLNCMFDGSRVIIAGYAYNGTGNDNIAHERNAADTATTLRVLDGLNLYTGTASYDADGNIYFHGVSGSDIRRKVWTRSSGVQTNSTVSTVTQTNSIAWVSSKRGYAGDRIDYVYTDGTASPYNVTYDGLSLNQPPNKPPIVSPKNNNTVDRNKTTRLDWDFSDPDSGDSQSKFDARYRVVGTATWTDITTVTTNTFHDLAPGTLTVNDYEWQVRTYDQANEVSVWSDLAYFTAADQPSGHSITDPVTGQTISEDSYTVHWSASQQTDYELRRVADNGAGAPDTANVLYTTGEVASASARSRTLAFPTNNQDEHIQLRYKNENGLWSTWDSIAVTVSYTTPPSPVVTAVGNDLSGYIAVAIDNPDPAAGEPSVTDNNLFRREEGSNVVKIAEGLVVDGTFNDYRVENRKNYEYQAQAVGDNGTTARSAWAG